MSRHSIEVCGTRCVRAPPPPHGRVSDDLGTVYGLCGASRVGWRFVSFHLMRKVYGIRLSS